MAKIYPTPAARDRAIRDRAIAQVAATDLGFEHPAVSLAQRFLEVVPSAKTAKAYADGLVRYFDWCVAAVVDPFTQSQLDAAGFVTALSEMGFAPKTVNVRVAAVGSLISTAVGEGLVGRNPWKGLKKPAAEAILETPALDYEKANRLAQICLEALDGPSIVRQRNGACCYLMFRLGPRSAETAGVRFGHLTERPEGVTWRVHGKGNRWASLVLPPDVADVLARWRAALERRIGRPVRPEDALVPSLGLDGRLLPRGGASLEPMGATRVSAIYEACLDEIGVSGPRFAGHSARATAACLAYLATRDLVAVQRMLRHADPAMTERYLRSLILPSAAAAWTPEAYRNRGGEAA